MSFIYGELNYHLERRRDEGRGGEGKGRENSGGIAVQRREGRGLGGRRNLSPQIFKHMVTPIDQNCSAI